MHSEWGQPTTDEHEPGPRAAWQWDGPVLRNQPRTPTNRFHWGLIETIVWIATRDMPSVEGALGYLAAPTYLGERGGTRAYGPPSDLGLRSRIVIETHLPGDVSGHAQDCSPFLPSGCQCDDLGRVRFCRCSPAAGERCECTPRSIDSFFEAVHGGLPLFGVRDDDREPISVPRAALAAAALIYAEDGLRLLVNFASIHIPVAEVLRRWPAGFEDRPLVKSGEVPGEPEAGRGDTIKKTAALECFIDRAERHQTKPRKIEEARAICRAVGDQAGDADSVSKYLRPYHSRLFSGRALNPGAVPGVVSDARAELEAARMRRVTSARSRGKAKSPDRRTG